MRGKRTYDGFAVATQPSLLLLETILAKEAKDRFVLWWKTPRLSDGADRGLQYGLSGNRVFMLVTHKLANQTETACTATAGFAWGKPTRPKP